MLFVKFSTREIEINNSSVDVVRRNISQYFGLADEEFYLLCNGKRIENECLCSNAIIHVVPRTLGGKGGFGSMLRAIGAQIEKTTNREACRDLSGRRLRDINEEKRLKTWISQKEDREREAREKRRQKLERQCQEPKVEIKDEAFIKQRLELTENINDSIEQGLKAGCSGQVATKRKCEESNLPTKKKKALLLDFPIDSDDDVSSSDEELSNDTERGVVAVQ